MKKLISIPLMLIIMLSLLAGCTDSNGASTGSTDEASASAVETNTDASSAVESESESEASSAADADTDVSSTAESELSSEATDAEDTSTDDGNAPMRGLWTDSTYTNDYMNLTFTMPDDWVYATDDEIASAMGIALDTMTEAGMEISEEMMEQQAIYDMMAQNTTTLANVIIAYENLSAVIGGSMYTEELYFSSIVKQYESSDMGFTFPDEVTETTIGDETYYALNARQEKDGIVAYQTFYAKKIDSYMSLITISATSQEEVDEIFSYFS